MTGGKEDDSPSGDLPDWAIPFWEELGKPDISEYVDVLNGPLLDRRSGLRQDGNVEVLLNRRVIPEDMQPCIRGRLLGTYKSFFELVTEDGRFHRISKGAVVDVILVAHMRPAYIDDDNQHKYERDDQKRRKTIHEDSEKKSSDYDDSHVWG